MNIVLDIGNTRIKTGFYSDYELIETKSFSEKISIELLENIWNKTNPNSCIVSSTAQLPENIKEWLKIKRTLMFSSSTPIPVTLNYKTPETLGRDRIAGAIAANHIFPKNSSLVIDLGTCITYDLINEQKIYHGGAISPGMKMRFQAMNSFTGKLPLIEKPEFITDNGRSTTESLNKGVMSGIAHEINGFVRSYTQQYNNLKVILTGGDASLFEQHIENPIFAAPNLILDGLNLVLLYNKQINE